MSVDLSYCVVNTNGREFLRACLGAIEATHPVGVEREILVLDNASTDGSAAAVRALGGDVELIERERPTGKAENDSLLMERAKGRFCPLLNEDSNTTRAPPPRRRSCSTPTAPPTPAPGASPGSGPRSPGRSSCTAG
jgi:GT2 family glycosyltransferase